MPLPSTTDPPGMTDDIAPATPAFTDEDERFMRRALQLATLLEPLLIVGMGLIVMLIVLAVLMPIIQLNQFVK